ncbi:hypothetical protein G9C98_000263 [Cotesia typhae]|uniref:Ataxin-10 domain-containing protein n=1 Tax=Cotesia typhae TaxID=2053667 RepID=A0A8J5R4X7_9HYME|nr:hypothetical protein G9C98_000263 [Cotesia typhae]
MELLEKLNCIDKNCTWEEFYNVFNIKNFPEEQNGKKNRRILAKLGACLSKKDVPSPIKVIILKSFKLACLRDAQYHHKPYKKNYSSISSEGFDPDYPTSCFPFDEVTKWAIDNLTGILERPDEADVIKESLSFLCNMLAYNYDNLVDESCREKAINLLGKLLMDCKEDGIVIRACCLTHNIMNTWYRHFHDQNLVKITERLLEADECGFKAARDSLMVLLKKGALVRSYEDLSLDSRLYFLELVCKLVNNEFENLEDCFLPKDTVLFLIKRFKERSNLILKTEESYVKEQMKEPAEVIILLDILATLSCKLEIVKRDASLLINVVFLLKAIHMAGKSSSNNFTPLQKLAQVAPGKNSDRESIESHVAFGFKSSLVQELDGMSLILDCCNIDARNPLIMQWCILAIRNLLKNNPANQELIRNSQKIRFIDTEVIREMGITLNQDVNPIGIVPLPD